MSFNKGNSADFSSEKWKNEAFRGVYNSRIREKVKVKVKSRTCNRPRP